MAIEDAIVARSYAGILGLLALVVSLVHGLLAGGGTDAILWTAWYQFLAFAVLGAVIGWIADRVVQDSVQGRIAAEVESHKTVKPTAVKPAVGKPAVANPAAAG